MNKKEIVKQLDSMGLMLGACDGYYYLFDNKVVFLFSKPVDINQKIQKASANFSNTVFDFDNASSKDGHSLSIPVKEKIDLSGTANFRRGGVTSAVETKAGGVIVNEHGITTSGDDGGVFKGKRHSDAGGGIRVAVKGGGDVLVEDGEPIIIPDAVNSKETVTFDGEEKTPKEVISEINENAGGVPIKKEGGEINVKPSSVIVTRTAILDNSKHEFEGEMLTNRQILSKINERGGGAAFADGGEIEDCACAGNSFKYGGNSMSDYEIVQTIKEKYPDAFKKGVTEETEEHKETFKKLSEGVITSKMAAEEVVAAHLRKKADYYDMYEDGGLLKYDGKKIASLPLFVEVGEPVKSPYEGDEAMFYKIWDTSRGEFAYYKNGNKRNTRISAALAYKTYLFDNFGIHFKRLPVKTQNGLLLGKQNLLNN